MKTKIHYFYFLLALMKLKKLSKIVIISTALIP